MKIIRENEIEIDFNKQCVEMQEVFDEMPGSNDNKTKHFVIHGDSLSDKIKDFVLEKEISPRLVVTSPPYNAGHDYGDYNDKKPINEYVEFLHKFIANIDQILLPGGRFVINIRDIAIATGSRLPIIVPLYNKLCCDLKYNYRGVHIWYKGREESSTAWGSWMKSINPAIIDLFEYVYVFQKSGEYPKGEDNLTKEEFIESNLGVWKIRPVKKIYKSKTQKENKMFHPCPFPTELVLRVIKLYTHVGDWIIDPFGGVGSSSLAAIQAGRNSISVDLNKEFCKKALERVKTFHDDADIDLVDAC